MPLMTETKLTDEETVEIRVVPVGNMFVVQIASDPIRGTLLLINDIEEEELIEFAKALSEIVAHLEVGDSNPNERGS